MVVTWNWGSLRARMERADALVLSVGKSGRTWLRVLLNKYLSLRHGVPFDVDDLGSRAPGIPSVLFTHELWEHLEAGWFDRLRGRHIVPDRVLARRRVVVLHRDPRDVVVSLHFQRTRRSARRLDLDLETFARDPRLGLAAIVRVMNVWRRRLADHPRCLWMSYEAMRGDTRKALTDVLGLVGDDAPCPDLVRQAVDFAAFDNMRRMEATGAFASGILRPGNAADPDSFKVREGKVGGFRARFSPALLAEADDALAALDSFYGYGTR
jgi:hypothetical protein